MEKNIKRHPILSSRFTRLLLPLVLTLISMSCYSSVAVKGTPVKQLAITKGEAVSMEIAKKEEIQELYKLSKVKENKVFKLVKGMPEYRIGPLDVLQINTRVGERVTTTDVTVNSAGKISFSFVDDLKVAGLSPSELDEVLTRELSKYIKNPRIDILVKEYRSKIALLMGEIASLRSAVTGRAASGKVYLKGKTSLIDLISQAGGYTIDADVRRVRLTRGGKSYYINLFDILTKGDYRLDVIIDDGDVIDIPELTTFGERVYVLGEVSRQGIYSLKNAQDLLAALSLAGGITRYAKEKNTLIVRPNEPGKRPLVMMADVKSLLRKGDLSQNISLADGDLVFVPPMFIKDINDFIENTNPLLNFLFWPDRYRTTYWVRDWWKKSVRTDIYLSR